MNEYLLAQITEHCQMVKRGAKPMSLLPIQNKYNRKATELVMGTGLYYTLEVLNKDWSTIYIYKNKIIDDIIDDLPEIPTTAADHVLLGFLLGYDIESICEYIEKHCPKRDITK